MENLAKLRNLCNNELATMNYATIQNKLQILRCIFKIQKKVNDKY